MFRVWLASLAIAALGLILAGCGGGTSSPTPGATMTIPDMTIYLAQSRCADGGLPSTCAAPVPQKASDPMSWRRWDGQDQYEDAVVTDDGTYWITTWSYPPYGSFVAANGDGGQIITSDGTTVSIVATEDGSTPGIQRFPIGVWGLYNNTIPNCADGWGTIDVYGRACRATVTYPASGGGLTQIVADTIISEHYSGPNQTLDMERFYMASGWGMACWESYSVTNPARGGIVDICGTGAPSVGSVARDRRRLTNLVAMTPPLTSVAANGWPLAGFAP